MPYAFHFQYDPEEVLMPFAKRYHTTHRRGNAFSRAPRRFLAQCVAVAATTLLLSGIIAHTAEAQAPALGDAYVFFVDGVNVTLPAAQGAVVDDPKDATNKAIRFDNVNWGFHAFRFHDHAATPPKGAPVDMSANRDAENALSFRILVDPANEASGGNEASLAIMFEDFGAPPTDPMDNMTADLPFRLRWTVPTEMRDGEWHEVSLTLPPATWKELEDGKLDKSIADLDTNWVYGGAWTPETEGVAISDLMGPNTTEKPELWKEFEWDNVRALGVFWDWGSAGDDGGPVHLDDVFIGPADYDLSDAAGKPAAMTGVMVAADGPVNVISWTHNPDFGGYKVYASENPITDVSADGVLNIGNLSFEAEAFEVRHRVELPSSAVTLYYAVTSLSAFGVENADVSNSAVEIANPDITSSPWILPLTAEQDGQLFDLINQGMASNAPFPEGSEPFVVDDMHSQLSENGVTLPDNNEDLSAKVWVAYYEGDASEQLEPTIWVYAEVADDVADYATKEQAQAVAWQYDSIELGWGNYDVIDAGGTLLGGSPHSDMGRGENPDYQLRISPHGSPSDAEARTFVFRGEDFPGAGGAAYQSMTNGYKVLAQFLAATMKAPGDADPNFPGMDDPVRYMPLTITLNDADGEGNDPPRVHQITWSLDPTVNNNWWNTPSQWQAVAMGYPPVVSAEGDSELPEAFALDQNYPNPFNPATTIRFQLPQAEQVTLRVFDVLGREVATLLEDALIGAGEHTVQFDAAWLTSGLYLYRLEAGASFAQTRRMMLVK